MNLTIDDIVQAVESDNNAGFCRKCGEEHSECEPDARNRKCESCGEFEVFGAEELLIMGFGTMAPKKPKNKRIPALRAMTLKKIVANSTTDRFNISAILQHTGILTDSTFMVRVGAKIPIPTGTDEADGTRWQKIPTMLEAAEPGEPLSTVRTELIDYDLPKPVHVEFWFAPSGQSVRVNGILRLTVERFAGCKVTWRIDDSDPDRIVATTAGGSVVGLLMGLAKD